jgi:hypothetical protein
MRTVWNKLIHRARNMHDAQFLLLNTAVLTSKILGLKDQEILA